MECLAADATNPGDIVSGLKNVVFRSGLKMRGFCDDRGKNGTGERERQKCEEGYFHFIKSFIY